MSGDFLNNKTKKDEDIEIPEMVQSCPYCGEPLGEDKTFCGKCGKYLGANSVGGYKPLSDKTSKIIRWSIGIVALIIFAVIYFTVIK